LRLGFFCLFVRFVCSVRLQMTTLFATRFDGAFAGLLRRSCLPSEEDDLGIAIAPLWLTET
jgi:hypothetical protein